MWRERIFVIDFRELPYMCKLIDLINSINDEKDNY